MLRYFKLVIDGDGEDPTICGTCTEEHFCGQYNIGVDRDQHGVCRYASGRENRWRIRKPAVFLDVPLEYSGYKPPFGLQRDNLGPRLAFEGTLHSALEDIASMAFWHQIEPHTVCPQLPHKDYFEVISVSDRLGRNVSHFLVYSNAG